MKKKTRMKLKRITDDPRWKLFPFEYKIGFIREFFKRGKFSEKDKKDIQEILLRN